MNLSPIITCPNCKMRVIPRADGTCPSCQAPILQPAQSQSPDRPQAAPPPQVAPVRNTPPPPGPRRPYEQILLSKINGIPLEFFVSPDASKVAWLLDKVTSWNIILNHETSQEWNEVTKGSLVFSPDSQRLAYVAERDGKLVVVVDDLHFTGYDAINSKPVFSPDSKHFAFIAQSGRGQTVVVDGKAGPLHEGIGDGDPVFSPGSDRLAYTITTPRGAALATVDVKHPGEFSSGPWFDGIARGMPVFSPDGRRVAYVAGKAGKFLVVVDEHSGHPYEAIPAGSLGFSPDGRHVAYIGRNPGQKHFLLDGRVTGRHADIMFASPIFGEAKSGYSYVAKNADRWIWMVNGKEQAEINGFQDFEVARDLSRIASIHSQANQTVLMMNGSEVLRYSEITAVGFSQDSMRWACAARDRISKRGSVVVDGKFGPEFKRILRPGIFFSPDSKHSIYVAELPTGEEAFVLDHEIITSFSRVCGDARPSFQVPGSVRLAVIKNDGTVVQISVPLD